MYNFNTKLLPYSYDCYTILPIVHQLIATLLTQECLSSSPIDQQQNYSA